MSKYYCAVQGCKVSVHNLPPGVVLHPCPTETGMRNKWLVALKQKCSILDWARSRICSKHFRNSSFQTINSMKQLKPDAVPYFDESQSNKYSDSKSGNKSVFEKCLSAMTTNELTNNIQKQLDMTVEPPNMDSFIDFEDVSCKRDTPESIKLWILVKKQAVLISKMSDTIAQNKKQIEMLQRNSNNTRTAKKEMEKSVESYKYIVKCLQEKHATLEEQIEILTAVESR